MPSIISTGLFIGNFSSIDIDETNFTNEGLLPTGNLIDVPTLKLVDISQTVETGSNTAYSDDRPDFGVTPSSFTYDLGGGSVTSILDAESVYVVDVVLGDGSHLLTTMQVYQTQNGDTFLIPTADLDGRVIKSVTLISESSNDPVWGKDASDSIDGATVICFTKGTMIMTILGEVAVEELSIGDQILTRDNGYQPIRWIGSVRLGTADLALRPHLRPIRIQAGALGNGLPSTDLMVSPQHRVLVTSVLAQRMFGEREVLVAAKHLTAMPGIEIAHEVAQVEYWHFLLDAHQIVLSNGAPTESLFTGPEALKAVPEPSRREILQIFPQLTEINHAAQPVPARMLIPGRRASHFAERVVKNQHDLIA